MKNITISSFLITTIAIFGTVSCNTLTEKPIVKPTPINGSPVIKNDNSLVFGQFYGSCQGEKCIETFKIENNKLYEDKKDNYNHVSFDFEQLSANKYHETKELLEQIPTELLMQPSGTIGCPDCADQGGTYIQYKQGTDSKTWRIDNNLANVPVGIHPFMNAIKANIDKINNIVICPAVYEPVCAKEVGNDGEIFKTYSNSCVMNANAKGLIVSTTEGSCK